MTKTLKDIEEEMRQYDLRMLIKTIKQEALNHVKFQNERYGKSSDSSYYITNWIKKFFDIDNDKLNGIISNEDMKNEV